MVNLPIGFDASVIFLLSALVCSAVLATRRHHLALVARRGDQRAIQAAHHHPTPRLGGLALISALLPIAVLMRPDLSERFWLFSLSLVPVFLAGLLEDLGWPVKPRLRLLAAALSALLVVLLLGAWLPRLDVPGLDRAMGWAPFAILFTVFACAGICNGFNLIDGINGLAAGVGVLAALAMAAIAARGGAMALVELNLMVIAALMGFLVFNFPWGKIFLGDAGAYSLGHILAWFAIALLIHLPDLSPWALVLVFFWPIADTFFAIWRRRRAGRPTGLPDRLHFHQLVMRAIEITLVGREARRIANPLATLVILPLAAAPALTGILLWNQPAAAFAAVIGFAALFVATYLTGLRFARDRRRRVIESVFASALDAEGAKAVGVTAPSRTNFSDAGSHHASAEPREGYASPAHATRDAPMTEPRR